MLWQDSAHVLTQMQETTKRRENLKNLKRMIQKIFIF